MEKTVRISLIIILIISSINISIGCDCLMTPLENHLEKVNIILRVKAIQILDTKEEREDYSNPNFKIEENIGYRAKFKIINNLKGNFNKGDTININSTFSNCEMKYKISTEYILFLRLDKGEYFMETCSYSQAIKNNRKSKRYYKKILRKLKIKN